ncbi:MAG: flagellar motor switch protein FliN [Pseudomonadota bacterium]
MSNLSPALLRFGDVSVRLSVELGRTDMPLRDVLSLGQGSVVALNRLTDELLDITANGKVVAQGEVIAQDGKFALRIVSLVGEDPSAASAAPPMPRAPAMTDPMPATPAGMAPADAPSAYAAPPTPSPTPSAPPSKATQAQSGVGEASADTSSSGDSLDDLLDSTLDELSDALDDVTPGEGGDAKDSGDAAS